MKSKQNLSESLREFDNLPDVAGIPIALWTRLSGRSRASTYRDIAAAKLESFTMGRSRLLRVGSCRNVLRCGL
jgi:hypothetical protein